VGRDSFEFIVKPLYLNRREVLLEGFLSLSMDFTLSTRHRLVMEQLQCPFNFIAA